MEKKTLESLYSGKIFRIPDYQRGYAWGEKQWKDFVQDIDALVNEDVQNHYTGTVVTYQPRKPEVNNYGSSKLEIVDVVDGQQRLTTCSLYLSILLRNLIDLGNTDYKDKIPAFLYSGASTRLILNNDTSDLFYDLLLKGAGNTEARTTHQKRLTDAYDFFYHHIIAQKAALNDSFPQYLMDLTDAIIRKLNFTFYTIEEECEIGMTFELMNSRGKDLSILELLKNYLMHWISRNVTDESIRHDMTLRINKNWKEVYTNIGLCDGDEDQCLRLAWTLTCTHTPKYWQGYEGFKGDDYIPIRGMSAERRVEVQNFIELFTRNLSEISNEYAIVFSLTSPNSISHDELLWLPKVHNAGNISNFLPLIVAARLELRKSHVSLKEYSELLQALEKYAYRVFLTEGKRSNAGMSAFFRWGYELFNGEQDIGLITKWIYGLARFYSPNKDFAASLNEPSAWYYNRRKLKYTLFEYELFLLKEEGKGRKPRLTWEDISDSTIEHILPQTPEKTSHWLEVWSKSDLNTYTHDLGNLVLTVNNSNYLNFDFSRKKGVAGEGTSYANSDIRQERKISKYPDWTVDSLKKRREELTEWIAERWKIDDDATEIETDDIEEDSEE